MGNRGGGESEEEVGQEEEVELAVVEKVAGKRWW